MVKVHEEWRAPARRGDGFNAQMYPKRRNFRGGTERRILHEETQKGRRGEETTQQGPVRLSQAHGALAN